MESAQGKYAQMLFSELFGDYSNALRPVEDTDKALNVTLQITLSQIKDMVSNKTVPCSRNVQTSTPTIWKLLEQHGFQNLKLHVSLGDVRTICIFLHKVIHLIMFLHRFLFLICTHPFTPL